MLFNSLDFAIFFPLVFFSYWFLLNKNLVVQNVLLVTASFIFYGWWDWRFLLLIVFSSVVDFLVGLKLRKTQNGSLRKGFLLISISANLGLLFFFKYYNFFVESFVATFTFFGTSIKANTLDIILPVGISFYTFQTLSYTIDVYRKKITPTSDFIAFLAFVSFFPQLVAGPIERASHLLPQFFRKRTFDYGLAVDGLKQILWGLFKKMVIADNCAIYANLFFNNSDDYTGISLIFGVLFFTFQIYCDFSGYSDIAIGLSRLLGFDLMKNFAFPYFSRDVAEFWRRWHISLSTWFRDYLYIPLGGSRGSKGMKIRNIFIIFIVSGLWHGANWTFVVWGALNALYFLPLLLLKRNRSHLDTVAEGRLLPKFDDFLRIGVTFMVTVFAWIFFRADDIGHALRYIGNIFSGKFMTFDELPKLSLVVMALVFFMIIIEWSGRNGEYAIQGLFLGKKHIYRWSFYYFLIILLFIFAGKEQDFIYFQF